MSMTPPFQKSKRTGYSLVELIIAVGLFALVMMLASGAYLMMINYSRQVQGIIIGIDNLSFALETMTRSIRTGTNYTCPSGTSDCTIDARTESFSFTDGAGRSISYRLGDPTIQATIGGVESALTDPSVTVSSLMFYVVGSRRVPNDYEQAHVTIVVSGTVPAGPGKMESFTVQTGATMRGSDI